MATIKKVKKYQNSGKPLSGDSTKYYYNQSTKDIMNATKAIEEKGSSSKEYNDAFKKQTESLANLRRQSKKGKPGYDKMGFPIKKNKTGGTTMAKTGGSFPDLNKDGKITKADILKGRGVIAKKGMKVKKAQAGTTLPKAEIPMKKTKPSSNVSKIKVAMKKGGKMTKTCKYGCK